MSIVEWIEMVQDLMEGSSDGTVPSSVTTGMWLVDLNAPVEVLEAQLDAWAEAQRPVSADPLAP